MLGCVLLGFFSVHVFFLNFGGGGEGGVDWLCGGFLYCAGFGLPYIYMSVLDRPWSYLLPLRR